MISIRRTCSYFCLSLVFTALLALVATADEAQAAKDLAEQLGIDRGICVLVNPQSTELPIELAKATRLIVYVQTASAKQTAAIRKAADKAGLLGSRVYAEAGKGRHLHLASNVANGVVVYGAADKQEVLRVLRPGGKALIAGQSIIKPFPAGVGDWSHPYHTPDNNPQSTDQLARAPYLTQFLAEPFYGPMPEVTVVSGGRMFKAWGHISFKTREQPLVNMLKAFDGYNGTLLWERKLREGFMVHRNTMIATPEVLYLADDVSCKLIDTATGKVKDEIVPPKDVTTEKVWKWMALRDGVLYALIGGEEQKTVALRGTRAGAGWPWNGLGKGYGQKDYPWGFGHTLLAIDVKSKKVLWSHKEASPLDSRAACMNGKQLFFYSHGYFLGSLDLKTGKELWRSTDSALLAAVGEHDRAQHWQKGFSTQSYAKCSEDAMYFAGPQRTKLVAVSSKDGKLMWHYPHGNYQLILRKDALYALGRTDTSRKFDLTSGKVLADLECFRGNCTRATATVDSIFTRGHNHTGTQRISLDGDTSSRIPLMRPACQDGVIVAGGMLYWGPWMCDCNLSLVGIISLGSAGDFEFAQTATEKDRLESNTADLKVAPLKITAADWPTYRASNARSAGVPVSVGKTVARRWEYKPSSPRSTTAPIAAGGLIFTAGSDGSVQAINAANGDVRWTAYTGGRIFYPPSVAEGRVFVGSGDGWIYALEATSGRQLWRFRAAPIERRMPVYGHLTSTWPVASGALVEDGVVYAAAGIASYDGTHVYALDAATGKIRWQNNTSGRLVKDDLVTGVSVQGHLLLNGSQLYLAGGNAVSPASYDTKSGKCLNTLDAEWAKAPRGRELYLVGDQVRAFDRLLYSPKPYQISRYNSKSFVQASLGKVLIRSRPGQIVRLDLASSATDKPKALWQNGDFVGVEALAVTSDAVLAVGQAKPADDKPADGRAAESYVLKALNVEDGKTLWTQPLPVAPESWGMAVDREGRVLVTLTDGRVLCFAAGAEK